MVTIQDDRRKAAEEWVAKALGEFGYPGLLGGTGKAHIAGQLAGEQRVIEMLRGKEAKQVFTYQGHNNLPATAKEWSDWLESKLRGGG